MFPKSFCPHELHRIPTTEPHDKLGFSINLGVSELIDKGGQRIDVDGPTEKT